jgi:hypothetical protein
MAIRGLLAKAMTVSIASALCLAFWGGAALAQTTSIQVGSQINGALSQNDQTLDSGRYVDTYEFTGQAGQRLRITVTTTAFDAATAVGDGGDFFQIDDGSAAGTNASLTFTVPASGRYFVTVSSGELWRTGSYQLRLADVAPASASAPPLPAPSFAAPESRSGFQPQLRIGDTINGALGANDDTLDNGVLVDGYRLRGQAGQRVRLVVRPSGFTAAVAIGASEGDFFEMADMQATGGAQADLYVTLPSSGEYIVAVSAFAVGQRGPYTLWVTDGR